VLTLHSLALAVVVGINIALAMQIAGYMPRLKMEQFSTLFQYHWWAVLLVLFSGLGLLLAYPAKALTNPVFYLKLLAVIFGLLITKLLQRSPVQQSAQELVVHHGRLIALISLLLWIAAVTGGRFLAYTNSVLLASRFF